MTIAPQTPASSPDASAGGMLDAAPNPLRYDGIFREPDEITDCLCRLIPRGARLLDIGCGTGVITHVLASEHDCRIVGFEPDAARAELARARGLDIRSEFATLDAVSRLEKFDVVLFADVLEHTPQPAELLKVAAAALKPGGCVVVSVPNVAHWSVRLNLLFGRFNFADTGIMDATHLRWFTRRTLLELLSRSGFRIEAHATTAGTWQNCYRRMPLRLIPTRLRSPLVRVANRLMPRLFGCQHVVRAKYGEPH
jgi:methionine biosynthesis protein MetW